MQNYFYNLSGGVNQAVTKTELGLDTKKMCWADSKNVEILQNRGIIRQKGNILLFSTDVEESVIGLHEIKDASGPTILIATSEGHIYAYSAVNQALVLVEKDITGAQKLSFVDFLDGVVVAGAQDELFYINNDDGFPVQSCNLSVKSDVLCVYKGRLWVASGSTLYFSALGRYDDFSTTEDAGYINNFHTDTNKITALKPYKDYLAIYKENSVYLLNGTSPEDFSIVPFADKGTSSSKGVVNVNNKQYFINQGIFSMEQAGLLNQIQLGDEISIPIKKEFEKFDKSRFDEIIVLNYEAKHHIWYFIPYQNDKYFHNIWIYDYLNRAWFRREVPQNITSAAVFSGGIITADEAGNVYKEDFGNSFDGQVINFMWKSPFLAAGEPNVRKTVEEFYFVLDESYDNNFNFSVYKNYDSEYKDDAELIYSSNIKDLIWYDQSLSAESNFCWNDDENEKFSYWASGTDSVYKAEISESNYSVQLCAEGSSLAHNLAIIGLEFKEIYIDE